jgi:hypothetical protein
MGHLHAQFVDATDKTRGLLHAMLEPLLADELHRFHQGASGVPQQDPIDGVVDVGAQAGSIQEGGLQIHRLGQMQLLRGLRAQD